MLHRATAGQTKGQHWVGPGLSCWEGQGGILADRSWKRMGLREGQVHGLTLGTGMGSLCPQEAQRAINSIAISTRQTTQMRLFLSLSP